MKISKDIKKFFKAAKPALKYKWCYLVSALISLVMIGLDLAYAEVNRTLFDGLGSITARIAVGIIISFAIVFALQYLFGFIDNCLRCYFNESVVYAMRRDLLRRVEQLPMEYFDNNHFGKITNIFFGQLEYVKHFVVSDLQDLIRLPLSFLIISAYLFTVHPYLGIIAVVSSVLQPISNLVLRKAFAEACDDVRGTTNGIFSLMGEATQGIREVKLNQIEDYFDSKMGKLQELGVRHNLRIMVIKTLRWIVKELPVKAGYLAGIAVAISLMIKGAIGAGELIAFITLLSKVSEPFDGITSVIADLQESLSSADDLIKLLYRFYEPSGGSITVNGVPLDEYNISKLRSVMAVVSQDIFMFDGTVRENLLLGRKDITDEELIDALKYSESYDFIMNLPDGLETNLGERGIKISQGQKQRLSIARAILKKASIIILDEPTSALDVETEYNFQQGLNVWAKDATKIIIAHRLTTIRDADYIVFLEEGHIAEQGIPSELIKKTSGKFKEYWDKQFIFTDSK